MKVSNDYAIVDINEYSILQMSLNTYYDIPKCIRFCKYIADLLFKCLLFILQLTHEASIIKIYCYVHRKPPKSSNLRKHLESCYGVVENAKGS